MQPYRGVTRLDARHASRATARSRPRGVERLRADALDSRQSTALGRERDGVAVCRPRRRRWAQFPPRVAGGGLFGLLLVDFRFFGFDGFVTFWLSRSLFVCLSSTWTYWTPRRRVLRAWRRMCYRLARRRRRRWRRRRRAGMPTGRRRREGRRDIFLQTRRLRA